MTNRNMHIAFISHEYPRETGWGGIGTYIHTMAHGLAALGMRVSVLAGTTGSTATLEHDGAVQVLRIPTVPVRAIWRLGPATSWSYARALVVSRALRAMGSVNPPDVIEFPEYGAEGLFTRWSAPRTTARVVRLHTPRKMTAAANRRHPSWDLRYAHCLERLSVRFAHAVTSPSRNLAIQSRQILGLHDREVRVIPNPVDVQRFRPLISCIADGGTDTILYVGRLEFRKGVHRLIPVIPRVLDRHPTARFVFAGTDTMTSPDGGSMQAYLDASVPARHRGRVIFLGAVPHPMLPKYLVGSRMCLVPSYYENFPYVVLEAMACGRPVIASPVGGIPEIIEDGVTGYLSDPDSSVEFADIILSMLKDTEAAARIGMAARQHIVESYRAERVVATMRDYFRDVCDQLRGCKSLHLQRGSSEPRPATQSKLGPARGLQAGPGTGGPGRGLTSRNG